MVVVNAAMLNKNLLKQFFNSNLCVEGENRLKDEWIAHGLTLSDCGESFRKATDFISYLLIYIACLPNYFFALPPPLQWRWYCENERWSFKTLVERSLAFTALSRNPSKHTKPSDSQFTTVTNVSLVNRNHSTGPDALDWQNLFGPAKYLDKICLCQMFNLSSVDALRQQSIC